MKKVCIVTGGSSGIGYAIVQTFLNADYQVFNLDLNDCDIGEYIACDVSDVQQVQTAISQVIKQTNRVDALVSNAGIHVSANIEQTDEALLDKVFAINVKGAYAATQSVLAQMKTQQHGSIIYIASDQSVIGKTNSFAYNLSKHSLASMAKTTALDYAQYNIRANAICPGTIETPLYHNAINAYCKRSGANKQDIHAEEASLQPLNRLGQPHEVAELALFMASDKATFMTGSLQVIDGGYTTG